MKYDKVQDEHVDCTLSTGNQIKILIEEFSLGREDDAWILATQENSQKKLMYIANLKKLTEQT